MEKMEKGKVRSGGGGTATVYEPVKERGTKRRFAETCDVPTAGGHMP
ncbi:MAG: hypothetical protein SWQ30_04940 [Thermodesulfobacteriota bacterium]|nr:hypothetical protein [Thermodesulfobacteriota bacterium]